MKTSKTKLKNRFLSSEFCRATAVLRSFIICGSVKEQWIILCWRYLTLIFRNILKSTTIYNLQNDSVVETSLVGTVLNGLSHLHGCTDRGQFIISLLRGLGSNLNMKSRQEFAKEVIIFFTKFIKSALVYAVGIAIFCFLMMHIYSNRKSVLSICVHNSKITEKRRFIYHWYAAECIQPR